MAVRSQPKMIKRKSPAPYDDAKSSIVNSLKRQRVEESLISAVAAENCTSDSLKLSKKIYKSYLQDAFVALEQVSYIDNFAFFF